MGGMRKIKREGRIEMAWKRVVTVDVRDSVRRERGRRERVREKEGGGMWRERERDGWNEKDKKRGKNRNGLEEGSNC